MSISRVRSTVASRFLPCSFFTTWSISTSSPPPNTGIFPRSSYSTDFTTSAARKLEDSPVFRGVQLMKPPPTLNARKLSWNSCSFIGDVAAPLIPLNTKGTDKIGYYTWLDVKARPSDASSPSFQILVTFWNDLAKKAYMHLQKEDLIYVWGSLNSYEKIGENEEVEVLQKLTVRDLNFVQRNTKPQIYNNHQHSDEEDIAISCNDHDLKRRTSDRLKLWQVFLANPEEWWDNRHSKRYPSTPDFKHKDTGEELTLREDDPPWIERQLKIYDTEIAHRNVRSKSDWSSFI